MRDTFPVPISLKSREIRSFTGLRGIAAILVMVYHFGQKDIGVGLFRSGLNHGYLWVDLFFILSGYVMALTHAGDFAEGAHMMRRYAEFLGRRVARIYPLYGVVTLVTLILLVTKLSHDPLPSHLLKAVAANVLLVQAWCIAPSIVAPAWSISTECAAYFLFPILLTLTLYRHWMKAAAAVFLGFAVLLGISLLPDALVTDPFYGRSGPLDVFQASSPAPLLRCLAEFTFGLVAYRMVCAVPAAVDRLLPRLDIPVGLLLLLAFAVPGTDLLAVVIMVVLLMTLSSDRGILARILGTEAIRKTGVWSYAIYLLHPRMARPMAIVENKLGAMHIGHAHLLAVLVASCLTILCAAAAHMIVERPGRRFMQQIFATLLARTPMAAKPAF
jgi:peptidoglycan/LPS O-acetylase OafA/YrhL